MSRQNVAVQMKSLSCSKKHAQAHNSWFSFQFSGRKKKHCGELNFSVKCYFIIKIGFGIDLKIESPFRMAHIKLGNTFKITGK